MFKCKRCNILFSTDWRKSRKPKKKGDPEYCSVSCAHSHEQTYNQNEQRRIKMQGRGPSKETIEKIQKTYYAHHPDTRTYCFLCGDYLPHKSVSGLCSLCFKKKVRDMTIYRHLCQFDFDINNFPEEFDLQLLSEWGWYSPSNKGNNLQGVSKDHMVSISYGLLHNISPETIRHPANCQLLQHSQNSSKHTKCSITIENLRERILRWNTKYGSV